MFLMRSSTLHLQQGRTLHGSVCRPQSLQTRRSLPLRHLSPWQRRTKAAQRSRTCSCTAQSLTAGQLSSKQSGVEADIDAPEFDVSRIPGDGSCLFRALAQGAYFLESGTVLQSQDLLREGFRVREAICGELLRHRDTVAPFIQGDFDAYVTYMATEGTWGGEPELAMAVHCLQRPILIYKLTRSSLFGSDLDKVSEYGVDDHPGVAPICLLYSGCHYDVLLPKF